MLEKLKAEIEEGWEDEEKELRDAFDKIDKDGKGTVGRDRIGDLAKEMGRPMEEWELDVAMNHMDADGNGTVDYDEFAVWWEKNDARLKFTGRTGKKPRSRRPVCPAPLPVPPPDSGLVAALQGTIIRTLWRSGRRLCSR